MGLEFLDNLTGSQVEIPAMVSRIAGFFLVMQALLIVFQKKNDPFRDIWEDISGVLLAGLVVFLFPELIKFFEVMVNAVCTVDESPSSAIMDYIKTSNEGDGTVDTEPSSSSFEIFMAGFVKCLTGGGGNFISYTIAMLILKPLADLVNVMCLPTYLIIRAVSLKIVYWVAPLVLMLGALQPFRSLWKHWFMIYIALLVSGPALILANNFCEECFNIYIMSSDSPILGFIIIAMARYKAFQAVMDLCYKIFRV